MGHGKAGSAAPPLPLPTAAATAPPLSSAAPRLSSPQPAPITAASPSRQQPTLTLLLLYPCLPSRLLPAQQWVGPPRRCCFHPLSYPSVGKLGWVRAPVSCCPPGRRPTPLAMTAASRRCQALLSRTTPRRRPPIPRSSTEWPTSLRTLTTRHLPLHAPPATASMDKDGLRTYSSSRETRKRGQQPQPLQSALQPPPQRCLRRAVTPVASPSLPLMLQMLSLACPQATLGALGCPSTPPPLYPLCASLLLS